MTAAVTERSEEDVLKLLATLGQGLHRYGIPSHRLEDVLNKLACAFGHEAAVFSTPTLLMLRFCWCRAPWGFAPCRRCSKPRR